MGQQVYKTTSRLVVAQTLTHIPRSIPPALHVKSGDEITFDCLDASNGQVTAESTVATLGTMNLAALDQVNGPVFVEGAQPGDTLQVDVLRIENPEWGWTALFPGFGLLADEFPEPALKIWKLEQEGFAWFDEKKGMKVPLKPFAGEMGVVQKKKGAFSTIPPYHTGGNIDTKHVTVGSTLFLPVEVEGALFSIGVRMLVDGMICLRNCYHVGWSRRTGGRRYVPEPAAPYDLLIRDYVNRSMWYVRSALTYTRSEN